GSARPRRLRSTPALRRLVSEVQLHPSELILPMFVKEGLSEPVPLEGMPGVVQHTLESLLAAAEEAVAAGVGGLMLFGIPEHKDETGSQADDPDGILNRALSLLSDRLGEDTVVMADLCLDEFTSHGHCGVLDSAGGVDNDATLDRYASMAVAQARAGAQVLGLSGLVDGPVGYCREALDAAGLTDTPICLGEDTVVMADLCLDEFSSHGHCGVLDSAGGVDNDATLDRYASMAVAQARAGAQVLGLSGMMDGQVGYCREALDAAGLTDTVVMGYTAKYASAFYGPFREAVDSELKGARKTYQQYPANGREALRELGLDLAEGAD